MILSPSDPKQVGGTFVYWKSDIYGVSRLRLRYYGCVEIRSRVLSAKACGRVDEFSQTKTFSWCGRLEDFHVPNEVQPVMIWRVVQRMACRTISSWRT